MNLFSKISHAVVFGSVRKAHGVFQLIKLLPDGNDKPLNIYFTKVCKNDGSSNLQTLGAHFISGFILSILN